MAHPKDVRPQALADLIETVHRLRAPGGCPWDRAQTHQSLRPYLIEEAYETLDVLDQIHSTEDLKNEKILKPFREELGDVLMQVLIHSEMASETDAFNIYDVAQGLNDKLVRRHPHVFGDKTANSSDQALQNWEKEKAKEKSISQGESILDGVPRGLPGLQRAARVLEKVTKVGFQWSDMQGPLGKVEEEFAELKVEILKSEDLKKVESEFGDLLFSLCNVAYLMKINPEDTLRNTLKRFESRFRHVEQRLSQNGKKPENSNLQEMDLFWDEAKKLEKVQIWGLTGGVASGKSTVAKILSEAGIPVVDADQIAHDLIGKNGRAHEPILERFGTTERSQLRELVFSDPEARMDLEKILHPLIRAESMNQLLKLADHHTVIIYEAALLIETGRAKDLSGLILVEAPQDVRLDRLMKRDGMNAGIAQKMMDSQASDELKRKYADIILDNAGKKEDLQRLTQELIKSLSSNPK